MGFEIKFITMIAKQLITNTVTPLKTSDTGATALSWMDDYRLAHLPIVNNVELLGIISEKDIYEMNDFDLPLGNHKLNLSKPYVDEYQHIFDVIRMMDELKLTLVPILNEKKEYLGCITITDLIEGFAKIASMRNPGGIIVLEMSINDYSLSEIARIIESHDAKVLSLYITSHSDSTKLELTIKINRVDVVSIINTFNRYNYYIKASYSENENLDDMKDRFDSFIKYMNI